MEVRVEGAFKIRGPASLRVIEGSIEVLGGLLGEGSTLIVPIGRTYLGYTEYALIDVAPDSSPVTNTSEDEYWKVNSIAETLSKRVNPVIIGPTDSGKSTLASWTYNILSRRGEISYIMTTDIGQNEIYCPGFIARSKPKNSIAAPGGDYDIDASCFLGSFTPMGYESRYIMCASKLARGTENIIVDTDGWITPWRGLESKASLATSINSKIILAVNMPEKYAGFIEDVTGIEVIRIEGVKGGIKSREERRRHRERLIAKHLIGGRTRNFKIDETPVYGSQLFIGDPLPIDSVKDIAPNAIYAEKLQDGIVIVARGPPHRHRRILNVGWERGLLASLTYHNMAYPALVERINYGRRTIVLYTRYQGPVKSIEVGSVRLELEQYKGRV